MDVDYKITFTFTLDAGFLCDRRLKSAQIVKIFLACELFFTKTTIFSYSEVTSHKYNALNEQSGQS